jgi:hypothetical protein
MSAPSQSKLCIKTTEESGYCTECGQLLLSIKQVCVGKLFKTTAPQEKIGYTLNIPLASGAKTPPVKRKLSSRKVTEVMPKEVDKSSLYPNIEVPTLRDVISKDRMFVVEPADSPLRLKSLMWLKEKEDRRGCLVRVTSVQHLSEHKVLGFKVVHSWDIT